jgi:tetratricopeptide (TPR) repeat protein
MLFTALLFTTFAQAQIKVISWHKSNQKILKTYTPAPLIISRQELILELNNNIKKVTSMTESAGAWAGLIALNDRIATNQKTLFYFNDIAKDELISLFLEEKTTNGEVGIGNFDFCFDKYEDAQIFAENLYAILHHSYKELNLDSLLTAFKPVAEQYQILEVKPAVPEEQRKYIVQANVLNEEKKYSKALNFYEKAIKINPVSYPAAYYNMALIAAQTEDFRYAIFNMKKYLMLKPAAEDSRAAQDKIYVWELKL